MYSNKIVLITGSSRGVGQVIAHHFLENNATVIGLSRKLFEVRNPGYHHFCVDLSNPEEIIDVFKSIAKRFKKIDIVINNAAVLTSQYSMIMPLKNAKDMLSVNLLAAFLV